ncbi:MAG TPA: hypothetical protein DCP91_05930 [Eggerthellaceae bacterium]|nr:hypothetical protein [Eggerthellaceae bacterium]
MAGAALCGKNRSVLVLADDVNDSQAEAFVKASRAKIGMGYVFGGPKAVPQAVMDKLVKASGGAEVKSSAKAAASTSPTYRI